MIDRIHSLTVDQIAWDMKGPCDDCPFRRNAPDHEGVTASVVDYIQTIQRGEFAHTCHKTDNRPACDGPRTHNGPVQHCGGALLFITRAKCDLQLPLLQAAEAGKIDLGDLAKRARADERIFGSIDELLQHYLGVAKRIMDAKVADPVALVIADSPGDQPEEMLLSVAKAENREILVCSVCGKPAVTFDRYWPYFMSDNFCAEHSSSRDKAFKELEALAAGGQL